MYSAAFTNSSGTSPWPSAPKPKANAMGRAANRLHTAPSTSMNTTDIRVQAANSWRGSAPAGGSW